MKKLFNKILLLVVGFAVMLPLVPAVQAACDVPGSADYNSTTCIKQRLGFDELVDGNLGTVIIKRDPLSVIVVAFRVLLAVVVLIVVFRIVMAGIKIANSKDDADKRKDAFKQIGFALVGMVVALGALGITFIIQKAVFGETFNDRIVDCTEITSYADPEVLARCQEVAP
jgi:hypothetical protein